MSFSSNWMSLDGHQWIQVTCCRCGDWLLITEWEQLVGFPLRANQSVTTPSGEGLREVRNDTSAPSDSGSVRHKLCSVDSVLLSLFFLHSAGLPASEVFLGFNSLLLQVSTVVCLNWTTWYCRINDFSFLSWSKRFQRSKKSPGVFKAECSRTLFAGKKERDQTQTKSVKKRKQTDPERPALNTEKCVCLPKPITTLLTPCWHCYVFIEKHHISYGKSP